MSAFKVKRQSRPANKAPWKSRIVGHEDVDPKTLAKHPLNWREHPDRQKTALKGALNEIGWIAHITVNKRTGRMIDGHARLDEALAKGEKLVPVSYVDLSEDEERIALATLDPIGALAKADGDRLEELVEQIDSDVDVDNLLDDTFNLIDDSIDNGDTSPQLRGLEYRVVVDCSNEADQADLMSELEAKGRKCRPLIS